MTERSGGMAIPSTSLFDRCVKVRHVGQRVQIRCRLGLWSVEATNLAVAEREARHYWVQYWKDGEYDSLLSNDKAQFREERA